MSTYTSDTLHPGYEFTEDQERTVLSLGSSLRWTAMPMISLGLLVFIDLIMYAIWLWRRGQYENLQLAAMPLFLLGVAIMFVGIGAWIGRAGESFLRIAETRGNDIHHLMSALKYLDKVWTVIAGFVKALILLAFLIILFNLVHIWTERGAETEATRTTASYEVR